MALLVTISIAAMLSIISAIGCVLLYYRGSVKRERQNDRLDAVLDPYRFRRSVSKASSAVGWTDKILKISRKILGYDEILRAHRAVGVTRIVLPCMIPAVLAAYVAARQFGFVQGALLGLGVWLALSRYVFMRLERKYSERLFHQLPDALGMIVRSLRVGVPLSRALAIVAQEAEEPTAGEFHDLVAEVEVGRELSTALALLGDRTNLQDYRFFATVMSLQSQTGGTLAEVLAGLADMTSQRIATRKRGHALSSEARMSSYFIASLPFCLAGGLELLNPNYLSVFYTERVGVIMSCVAVGLLATGMLSIRFIMVRMLG